MNANLKALGAALIAALALGAITAAAASAEEFTAESYPVAIFGEQPEGEPHVWSFGGGNIQCADAMVSGGATGPSETQTITPSIEGCTAFGLGMQVTMNECDYLFHAGTLTEGGTAHSSIDLNCPEGKEVTFDTVGNICTVHIPPQKGINNITYTNNAGHVDVRMAANNIHATITKSSFLCPLSNQTVENASYTGDLTLEGSDEEGAVNIDVG